MNTHPRHSISFPVRHIDGDGILAASEEHLHLAMLDVDRLFGPSSELPRRDKWCRDRPFKYLKADETLGHR